MMKFTLCGSARFEKEFHHWNKMLGLMGHISYSLMTFPSVEGKKTWYTPDQKETLDLLHLAKIEESDAIFVLNKDGYIGESTARELKWALLRYKQVFGLQRDSEKRIYFDYKAIEGYHLVENLTRKECPDEKD
jgi:hypothetical protein